MGVTSDEVREVIRKHWCRRYSARTAAVTVAAESLRRGCRAIDPFVSHC